MTQINSPQLVRCAARPKEVRGGSRQSEAAELHPGLKGGEEPKLVRQGRRQPVVESSHATLVESPPVSRARRAMNHQRWQVGMA